MYIRSETSNNVADLLFSVKKDDQVSQWSSLVGIVTAIVGNILISFALNIQRYAHVRIDHDYTRKKQERKAKKKLPRALRGYGTAVQQEQVAQDRARLNATAPGPGLDAEDDASSDTSESSPLGESFHSGSTVRPSDKGNNGQDGRKSYLRSPYWWLGITLMTIGEAGNFLAYGFAPASIVSPLGVVALISNCLIAPLMLKERFRKRDFWGVLVAIGGAVTIVLSARTSEAKMGPDKLWQAIKRWEFLTYVCITTALIIVLMIASPRYERRTILIDLGLVGLSGGYTALSTKGVAAMLSDTLFRAFTYPITYLLVVILAGSAVLQIRYINRALSNFDSTQVIPTQFVLFTLSVILGSAVLYRDFEKTDLEHVIKFVAGCILTFSGVWLITSGRRNGEEDDDDFSVDETIRLIDEEQVSEPLSSTETKRKGSADSRSNSIGLTHSGTPNSERPFPIPAVNVIPDEAAESVQSDLGTSIGSTSETDLRPTTPQHTLQTKTNADATPFFTPSSAPASSSRRPRLGTTNSDSVLAGPHTPTRTGRPSPVTPGAIFSNGDAFETPPSNLFRSARGSIARLMPAPLIPPLPGALNTIVAESLLRGEGSPKFFRNLQRRRRSARARSSHPSLVQGNPHSAIDSPPITRWSTTDAEVPETPRTTISEYTPSSADRTERRRRGRLGSFGDSLTDFFKRSRRSERESEHYLDQQPSESPR